MGQNWANNGQKWIILGGDKDTSAYHISDHSFYMFSLDSETSLDGRTLTNMSPPDFGNGDNNLANMTAADRMT